MDGSFDYTSLVGTSFNEFEIKSIIGEGAMGVVYEAIDNNLDRVVALKVLKQGTITQDNNLLERFKLEAKNIAKLSHENIIKVYSVGTYSTYSYIAMEYVDGYKLSEKIMDQTITLEDTLYIMYMVAKALQYSHEHGILHRDIKPANIMISKEGRIKVVDFGLSKHLVGKSNLSKYGDVIGTPIYMAPELWDSSDRVTIKSDVYSLGVVFYEVLTGSHPYKGGSSQELYKSVLLGKYDDIRMLNPSISIEISNLINKCLKRDPDIRISLNEFIKDLKHILGKDPEEIYENKSPITNENSKKMSETPTVIINKSKLNNSGSKISQELELKYKVQEKYFIYTMIGILLLTIFSIALLIY